MARGDYAIVKLVEKRLTELQQFLSLLLGLHVRVGRSSSVHRAFVAHELSERYVLGLVRKLL